MSRYTADSRDRVLDAVDMVRLVSERTELRRAGVNSYFGRCPFHDERTPSFHVSPDEKLYHCFGCQASGDPFSFVMETEGLDFGGVARAAGGRVRGGAGGRGGDPAGCGAKAASRAAAVATRASRRLLHALPLGVARGR